MDIVLVCEINNLSKVINAIFLTTLVSNINKKYNIEVKIDYPKSRVFINIVDNKTDSIYIKRCKLSNILREIKKIESI